MPNSLGSTLIWRRSAARMVSCVMGTSEDLPVRLSVMVSVSRGEVGPSGFLVVVADSGESIEKSSEAAGRCRAFIITVHQRERRRKLVEGAAQSAQIQRVGLRPEAQGRGSAERSKYTS